MEGRASMTDHEWNPTAQLLNPPAIVEGQRYIVTARFSPGTTEIQLYDIAPAVETPREIMLEVERQVLEREIALNKEASDTIEKLLAGIWGQTEWSDDHDEILDKWREARGDAAYDHWTWWVGDSCEGESYSYNCETREEALEYGRREFKHEGSFRIVEARVWADDVKEGDEITEFAETRNAETIKVEDA